ncbi:hypothetical protein P9X10_00645 [Bacillus cereus]|nr:hypothetical protein [Bacillus cereus]
MDNINETKDVSITLNKSEVVTFEQFLNLLNKSINEDNKRSFTSTSDAGTLINGYIFDCKISENRCELKLSSSGTNEYHITYVPSIIQCITQKLEGVFTIFYENSLQIIKIQ